MELRRKFISNKPVVKKINDSIKLSEYEAGENKYANFIVDRCEESVDEVYQVLHEYISRNKLIIISQFLFGTGYQESANRKSAEKYFSGLNWAVTAVRKESQNNNKWGTIITAVSTDDCKIIYDNRKVIGNYYEDKYAGYYYFGGIIPDNLQQSSIRQSQKSFLMIEKSLDKAGMDIMNVTRTWFYLDDLLQWYDDFNSVRNDYFTGRGIFENLVPASTGIGACNFEGSAVLLAGFAVKKITDNVKIEAVDSPYQCPASDYKSSFSRAVEIDHPDYRHLIVSGTASITNDGETAHVGKIDQQIELTMKVVNGILQSKNMDWSYVTKGIAYCKTNDDINAFEKYCTINNLKELPLSIIQANICRDDLLFELEVDAVSLNNKNQ